MRGISWPAENRLASQEGLCSMQCGVHLYVYEFTGQAIFFVQASVTGWFLKGGVVCQLWAATHFLDSCHDAERSEPVFNSMKFISCDGCSYMKCCTIVLKFNLIYFNMYGPRQLSRYSDSLRAERSGDRILVGDEIFRTRPDRPCGPPSLLYNAYRVFTGVKRRGRSVDHPPHLSSEVMKG